MSPDDAIRFPRIYETGSGDYTKERQEWLPDNLDMVKSDLLEREKKRKTRKQG
nr:hypothetical protein [uncultured Methanoregula sp.]